MFGSQILEIAIGMVFVYLSLSLICSGINEWIASILQTRAKLLEQWLQDLFLESSATTAPAAGSPPAAANAQKPTLEEFQDHPLIKALSSPTKQKTQKETGSSLSRLAKALLAFIKSFKEPKKPAYIPSRTFVLTLLDVIAPANGNGSRTIADIRNALQNLPDGDTKTTMLALLDDTRNNDDVLNLVDGIAPTKANGSRTIADIRSALQNLPDGDTKTTMLDLLDAGNDADVLKLVDVIAPTKANGSRTIADIRSSLQKRPDSDIKKTMLALLDDAGDDAEKVRRNIEGWFNDAMERLSGLYKQRAKWVILGLSIVVTVLLNVNSLYVFNSLYHDGTLREAVVAAAEQAAAQPAATDPQAPITKIDQIQKELERLNLPIGWTDANPHLDLNNPGALGMTLLGWLITALAVSQGAPFWFDVLNKLVNVRTTGARPPTSSEPASPQVVVQPVAQAASQPASAPFSNGSSVATTGQ